MRKTKTEKGITLIALIITIVVLLILAAVAINSITNEGIISKAEGVADKYNKAVKDEQGMLGKYEEYLNKHIGSSTGTNVETIPIDENCVGYYVNLDDDKTDAEGIIYIDKANTQSGSWDGESYTITNVTSGLKGYTVIEEEYTTAEFGTAKLIEAIDGTTGTERFYVMALEDVNSGTEYCWYDAAADSGISDYLTVTATGIGAGKTNTATMLTKWNAEAYGAKDDNGTYADMWGIVEDGWYIPSKDEWLAFCSTLGITSSNFVDKGFTGSSQRWTSSLYPIEEAGPTGPAGAMGFYSASVFFEAWSLRSSGSVRLGTDF